MLRGFAKRFFSPKIREYYGSGWVGPGLTRNFLCGKSSRNSPKPVLIFWSSIPLAELPGFARDSRSIIAHELVAVFPQFNVYSVGIYIAKSCWLL